MSLLSLPVVLFGDNGNDQYGGAAKDIIRIFGNITWTDINKYEITKSSGDRFGDHTDRVIGTVYKTKSL